ncbi:MAG: DUF86 domain-containing protein [Calditrichaeota bacterium]|nr:MAG: DUF86 domain-containing protein [Calditrichota bacterium]
MNKKRTYLEYIEDIRDAMAKIAEFIAGMNYQQFVRDSKTVFAVVRALEIVGEATKMIPEDIRQKYPMIPWRDMARMRDKLIHHYFGVHLKVVWKTITEDLPELTPLIDKVWNDLKKEESE